MVTVNSVNVFPDDDNNDDLLNETNSSTTFTEVVYSPQWNRKSYMKKIPNKHNMKNKEGIVGAQSNKQSSWCSSKLRISNEEPQSFHRSSYTHTAPLNSPPVDERTHLNIFQSNQKPLNSYSSSQYTSSDDFYNNNLFVNRLRNPTVTQKYGHSYFDSNSSSRDSRNANFDSFFPENSTTSNSVLDNVEESREECESSLEMQSKYISEHRFHWSENIEYCSPWVRQRAKEIANHVNGLFELKKKSEILENDTKIIQNDLKSEVVREECGETDDDITYEIASKLCDTFLNHDETNVSENQCPNDEHFKWSNLYQKLIDYGLF